MKPSETSSVPQRARRSAVVWTPPKLVASTTSSQASRNAWARPALSSAKPTSGPVKAIWRPRSPSRRGGRPRRRRRARAAAPRARSRWPSERSRRRPSVASERWASQASKPPAIAPERVRQRRSAAPRSGSRTETAPSSTSECPQSALGAREHREVGAVGERLLAERGADGVVDGEQRARGVRGLGRGGDVDEVQARVGGRLDPHERRAVDRAGDPRRRHEPDLDAERLELLAGEAPDPRVAVAAGHEHVAGAQHGEQHGGDRGHAGGEHGALAAVELAERALQVRPGRVLVAAVAVGRRVLVPAQVVGRGEHRPRQQRVALRAGRDAGVDRARARAAHRADDSLARRCDPASSLACC